ncbi:MAG: alpha/beta hydrolase [Myxococcota bacterium]|nr:alpha/beta hydrolase [Myxococcota bacterium]
MGRAVLSHTAHGNLSAMAPTAVLVHGILGSRRNWASTARRLAKRFPQWHFITVDLRGHGDADCGDEPHTVAACADDLLALVDELGRRPSCVIGHSFGGKVALACGQLAPMGLRFIWSLDSDPGISAAPTIQSVTQVIDEIRRVPMPQAHRLAVKQHFERAGLSSAIGAWMTTNLRRGEHGFHWTFDLSTIESLLADYRQLDMWPFLDDPTRTIPVHFMLAGQSTWWSDPVESRLRALARSRVVVLPSAGHWLHIDEPDGMLNALSDTFDAMDTIGD